MIYGWLLNQLEQEYTLDHIYYMDEAGINSTACYEWGWSLKGTRCHSSRLGGYGQRRNFIAAIQANKPQEWLIPWVVKGTVSRSTVECWLTAFGEQLGHQNTDNPSSVLIMDNAPFHKKGKLKQMAQQYGIRLVYLPAYSPDLNPIEKCWAKLKHICRLLLGREMTLDEAIDQAFNM